MIGFFFLLTILYGYKEQTLAQRVEPTMHCISIGYPLVTAFLGAIKGFYSEIEIGPGCWINEYPRDCGDGPGGSGERCWGSLISLIFGGTITFFVVIALVVNNASIYSFLQGARRRSADLELPAHLAHQRQRQWCGLPLRDIAHHAR